MKILVNIKSFLLEISKYCCLFSVCNFIIDLFANFFVFVLFLNDSQSKIQGTK